MWYFDRGGFNYSILILRAFSWLLHVVFLRYSLFNARSPQPVISDEPLPHSLYWQSSFSTLSCIETVDAVVINTSEATKMHRHVEIPEFLFHCVRGLPLDSRARQHSVEMCHVVSLAVHSLPLRHTYYCAHLRTFSTHINAPRTATIIC